jgi:hypothetical protein
VPENSQPILSRRSRLRRFAALAATSFAVAALGLATAPAATADVPPTDAAAFQAPLCDTDFFTNDPRQNVTGEVTDLTQVFGQRLIDYNNGHVVPLYDSDGQSLYPPMCAVRYVDGVGPVSQWIFCTQLHASDTCAGVNEEGELLSVQGQVIPAMDVLADQEELTPDQEKLITYLILHRHPYSSPSGPFASPATFAEAGTHEGRHALQLLIWCVTDPADPDDPTDDEDDRAILCENNLDAAEQARILAQIPDAATLDLAFSPDELEAGESTTLTLTTNVYEQPIDLALSGVSGSIALVSGDADLTGTTLTVHGADAAVPTAVTLGVTAGDPGVLDVVASTTPAASLAQSVWLKSAYEPCQIYLDVDDAESSVVTASARATFLDGPTLAATGVPGGPFMASAAALLLGAGLLLRLRRPRAERHPVSRCATRR